MIPKNLPEITIINLNKIAYLTKHKALMLYNKAQSTYVVPAQVADEFLMNVSLFAITYRGGEQMNRGDLHNAFPMHGLC